MSLLSRRRVSAGLAVALSTGVLALASHALADGAGTTTVNAKFGAETWYQPDPTCMLPTGCVSTGITPPPINPYGAGTLHVSVSAGEETSRTYLGIGPVMPPAGATLTSAIFTAPLNTSTTAGSVSPDTSTVHVCSATDTITASEGEFDAPPASTSCITDVTLTYAATPTAEVTGDLAPLLNAHLADLEAGKLDLALLPLIGSPTAAWHDVFNSNDGSAAAMQPTLTLTFASADGSTPVVVVPTPSDAPSPTDSPATAATSAAATVSSKPVPVSSVAPAVTTAPAPVTAVVPPSTVVVPAPVAAATSEAPSPEVASTPSAQAPVSNDAAVPTVATVASTRTVGFAYPAVLLLPLVLVAGGAGLARIMTRDVAPPRK